MLNSFGTERGILTKRPRRKEGGGRAGHGLLFAYQLNIKQECFLVNDTFRVTSILIVLL